MIWVVLLAAIVGYNYFGELVAINDGAGWDGVIYRDMVLHIEDYFFAGGINKYHMHRFLPFAVVHFAMKWLSVPLCDTYIYKVSAMLNIVYLAVAVVCFFRLSRLMKWKPATEAMAFACAFFNFHVLKYMGYYPLLTDMMTLMLSYMAAFYYFRGRMANRLSDRMLLIAVGIVSLTVWPVLSMVVLLLLALPALRLRQGGEALPAAAVSGGLFYSTWQRFWRWGMVLWSPLFFLAYVVFRVHYRGVDTFRGLFVMRPALHVGLLVVAAAVWMAFVWRATKPLNIDWRPAFQEIFKRKSLTRISAMCLVFVLLYKAVEAFGGPSEFSFYYQLVQMSQFPLTDILIFLETHALYLGLFFMLTVLCWPSICRQAATRYGLPMYVLLLFALFFVADIETRKLTAFFPFMLVLLMNEMDSKPLRPWAVWLFVAVQLTMSCFWWHINVPGISQAFLTYEVDVYMQFPAQRYFMFQGPWQGHQTYLLFLAIELLLLAFIVVFHRQRIWYER